MSRAYAPQRRLALPQAQAHKGLNMNAQLSPAQVSRRVVRVIHLMRRPKRTNTAPARNADEVARVKPFIRVDPDAEPGRGRLGHCY